MDSIFKLIVGSRDVFINIKFLKKYKNAKQSNVQNFSISCNSAEDQSETSLKVAKPE